MNNKIKLLNMVFYFAIPLAVLFLFSCSTTKIEKEVVSNFDVNRYTGSWYEIARYDFFWEKNMSDVMTIYSFNPDGTIHVVNSGYDTKESSYKESVGKAKFVSCSDKGALKVSFFGPFYSAYNIVELDPDYQYALVAGKNRKLLWILSRTPTIPEDVKEKYLKTAMDMGYDLEDLVWTVHN